jgi:predicted porin
MKKSLFAAAALTAIAGGAQAQSSVTVYGILDVGYINSNSSITASNSAATNNYVKGSEYPNGNVKQTQSLFGNSAEQTSRLGFKGTEDLGGGTSAFFTAEFTLTPNEQTLSGNATGGLKNRQTFVGLKKNGLGDFAVGTQYLPVHIAVSKTDPGQQNNLTGSVIYTGQSDSGVLGGSGGNQNAYTTRVSNSLTLNSEVLAGFQAHAIAILNNNNSTALSQTTASGVVPVGSVVTGGMVNTNGWGLGLDYTWNKLFATANYQSLKQLTSVSNYSSFGAVGVTAAPTTGIGLSQPFANASGTTATSMATTGQALNIQDNQAYVGATYDFGILKAYASWVSRKATDTANSGNYQKRQAEQIGVRSFITPTVEGWASAGVGTFTPYGVNQNSAHFNAWQLGSNYWLSKRTNLYAIYGQYAQATTAYNIYTATTGAVAGTGQSSMNVSNFALGVRHTF